MDEIHHHYGEGSHVEVNHFHDADAALSDLQADNSYGSQTGTYGSPSVLGAAQAVGASNNGTPDADTKEADIVQAASVIAAAFISRNYDKHGDRGQYSLDTIVRMSVATAEKIHAAVHDTE